MCTKLRLPYVILRPHYKIEVARTIFNNIYIQFPLFTPDGVSLTRQIVIGMGSSFSRIRLVDPFATSVRPFRTMNYPIVPPEDKWIFLCLLNKTTQKQCILVV